MQLHVVAPTFDPAVVGGAGVVMTQLVPEFLRRSAGVRIYLNPGAARLFPEWRGSTVEVPITSQGTPRPSRAQILRLLFFGLRGLPSHPNAVRWYPFGFATPFWSASKAVVTLHDTLDRDLPSALPLAERILRRLVIGQTLRRAKVLTSSTFSQRQIHRHYGVAATSVPLATVPLGASLETASPSDRPAYVFYPANAWPHKNHLFLLDLWKAESELQSRYELVFTLGGGLGRLEQPIAAARRAGARVRVLGHITPSQLAAEYSRAECLAFPSLYEGFGLPVGEALHLGCPALLSDRGSLPETVPADYPFVLPLDPARWREALLSGPRRQAADFRRYAPSLTWREVADAYWQHFGAALDS